MLWFEAGCPHARGPSGGEYWRDIITSMLGDSSRKIRKDSGLHGLELSAICSICVNHTPANDLPSVHRRVLHSRCLDRSRSEELPDFRGRQLRPSAINAASTGSHGKVSFLAPPLAFSNLTLPAASTLVPYGAEAPEWSKWPNGRINQ
jgi:hypothetical protein